MIYLGYRWLLVLYFLSWQITSIVTFAVPTYMIYLTHWAFVAYNLSLVVSALSVTIKMISVHIVCKKEENEFSHTYIVKFQAPLGCCGHSDNYISWYQMFQWFFFIVSYDVTFVVFLLYWSLLHNGGYISGINANTHLVNGLIAVLDFWVSGIPVNTLHVVYSVIFGALYCLFTGLYYIGTKEAVYGSVLDYGSMLGRALGTVVLSVFVLIPLVHFIVFYLQYKLKVAIMYFLFRRNTALEETQEEAEDKVELPLYQ